MSTTYLGLKSAQRGRLPEGVSRWSGCGACGWSRKPFPGGPGRPSGSHYGEPAIAGRHGRYEREVKACASPVYRKRSGDRKRRVERRRACARVSSATAPGRTPPLPRASPAIGSGGSRNDGSVQRRSAPSHRGQGGVDPRVKCRGEKRRSNSAQMMRGDAGAWLFEN